MNQKSQNSEILQNKVYVDLRESVVNGKGPPMHVRSDLSQHAIESQNHNNVKKNKAIFLDKELDYYPDIYSLPFQSKNLAIAGLILKSY
jgi:succinylarginine dihydrolase